MKSLLKKGLLALALATSCGWALYPPLLVHAQDVVDNLESVGEQSGLGDEDIRIVIARFIRVGLSFLGVIAVCIVLYGGFVWMTAAGDPQKVDQAKRILINGGIGLVIILMAWGITTFIITSILGATGGSGGAGGSGGGGGSGVGGGGSGSSSLFEVAGISPEGAQSIRNIQVQIVFTHKVAEESAEGAIKITNTSSGEEVAGTLSVSGKRVTFVPEAACPAPNEDRFCFDESTSFTVSVSEDVENVSGVALTCSAESCSGSFTSGTLVDTESPTAEMTAPDDRDAIAADSTERVEVQATDDAAVAVADFSVEGSEAFESVVATGEDLTSVVLEALWETTGLTVGEKYEVSVVVTDIAGNTDEDAVTVTARPATCFNGIQDGEETDVDCGGDSASAEYCGACEGSSCSEDADCGGSSSCESGVCTDTPTISGLSPDNGAEGTFVTISGSGFGTSEGTITFTAETGGTVEAALASCADGWDDDEIIVVVPEGAGDGPITVTTSSGESDATNDEAGELVPDFDVNTTTRPSLCSITPSQAEVAEAVVLAGSGFGASRGESIVVFGEDDEAGSYTSWSDESATVTVPRLDGGRYSVFVVAEGVESNSVTLKVEEEASEDAPSIVSVDPGEGAVGQYITITGSLFGSSLGSVWFESAISGDRTQASIDFPDACEEDIWSANEITVIVPDVEPGSYALSVESRAGGESSPVAFVVTEGEPSPGLCSISPDSADVGDAITLYGDNFGSSTGTVQFAGSVTGTVTDWADGEIAVTVPPSATTGSLSVKNSAGEESNALTFTIASSSTSSSSTTAAAYAWAFSSGDIPDVPEVVVECSETVVSAVPNERFSEEACVNAQIYAEFTTDMNEATLDDGLLVEKCVATGDRPCSDTEEVAGTYTTTATSVTFSPTENLDVSTTYQVTISESALSADGIALARDVSWTFTTKADETDCEVERVVVSPDEKTLTAKNDTQGFSALPIANCNVLDASDYVWGWEVNESYAGFAATSDCAGGTSSCATVEALAEGTSLVTATERASTKEGDATLTINFSDPYVTRYFPNCTEACINAAVGATFNIAMDAASVESGAALYRCSNELCTSLTEVSGTSVGCTLSEESECVGFTFTLPSTLTPLAYYRVILSGDVTSKSGVPLIRTNYGDDFSWTFRVREDASVCTVERVTISPSSAQSSEVGDQKVFTAAAYGEADACSVSGQLLDAYSYAWTWEDPIEDENIDDISETVVAAWMGSDFSDTDPSSVAEGCTTSCTSAGSSPYAAVCGDGELEEDQGEECEDGNVTDGDGCSSNCLREGSDAITYACSGSGTACASLSDDAACAETCIEGLCSFSAMACTTSADCVSLAATCEASGSGCGDGTIGTFEDCDDGNTTSGDGCSSSCLAEGAPAIGATCGNSDVAYDATTYAGEECDDGNGRNGDGCSAVCTNEGTPTLASIGGAICGDGEADAPYEACDDGNATSGDGCSSSCLYEGASLRYAVPSTCGDTVMGTGEECDDGNATSGDGCSIKCVLEGASASYTAPSYCGDGVVGTGEGALCEAGASGDGLVDPVQAAFIADTAVFEVDEETGEAVATIRSTEASSTLTGEATWTLFCAATSDADCTDPSVQGVGLGNCCMDRPTVTLSPTGSDVCRNAALYGVFTESMDTNDFVYEKTVDGEDADSDGEADSTSEETSYRMYAALDLSTTSDGLCPDTHTTLVQAPSGFFARMWSAVRSFLFGRDVLATAGDCILPIAGYTQQAQTDSETGVTTFRVYMQASELMVAGATYTLIVEGDDDITDSTVQGARSRYGVGMNGNTEETFTVGSEICAVDAVEVTDTDTESPGVFSSLDEVHTFTAAAISYEAGSVQEIAPIEGVYDWTWSSWETDDEEILDVAQDSAELDTATVALAGENGQANVTATLTIETNTAGIETDDEISGYESVIALLCEQPWPAIEHYPWIDSADGEAVGAEEGIGWTNFSLGYCTDNDLPSLTVISPDLTRDDAILKEYLFQVQGTSDAIGIRVASNEEYLSPLAWYEAKGFTGSPSETTIDGFPAVEDGRTTYISAPNLFVEERDNYLYSNMYIISYNKDAGDDTIAIYNQLIDNIAFATNMSAVAYCTDGATYGNMCTSDLDCTGTGESCADIKGKVARDTRRLADMTDLRTALEEYGEDNGYCSETTDQVCTKDADCPGSETCEPGVPTLASGTFVRAFASSVWGSWNEMLSGALEDDVGEDPLNTYQGCGEDPYGIYDADTCVDQTRGQYLCPEGSYAYHYRAFGSDIAFLAADLEYPNAAWFYPIDSDGTSDGISITMGNASRSGSGFSTAAFCDGATEYGGSATCGDGLLSATEYCEVGQRGGTSAACDSNGDGTNDGYISQICNSTCTAFEDNPAASCTPASCGNGVVEGIEACDDGTANGKYGYCGSDCTMATAMFCGDGVLSGGEQCDCGDADVFTSVPTSGRAYGASTVGTCTAFNGTYTASPNAGCAWNCGGPPPYCGDGNITGSEQCDGFDDTWGGRLCRTGTDSGDPCTSDSDCAGGTCGGMFSVYAACSTGYERVMPCDDDAGGTCQYEGAWASLSCTEIGSCGDGVVDPDEECDDGNTDSTDACTAACKSNVCGDGYLYSGEEECDEGSANGEGCSAGYGSTCSACTTSCRQVVSSGSFCGDGVINGSEFCDGSDIPYRYFDGTTGQILGACDPDLAGERSSTDRSYTCRRLGVCNGGPENGEYCTHSSGPSPTTYGRLSDYNVCDQNSGTAVSCVFPTCGDSCMSSCPFTETTGTLLLTPNLPGSADSASVELYSYSGASTAELPNAANIVMPACTAAGALKGAIDMSNIDLPDAYVVFVTDRSGSMDSALGSSTRMEVAKDVLSSAITNLFEGLGSDMHITLVGYSSRAGTGMCSDDAQSCSADGDCGRGSVTCDDELSFLDIDDESTLLDRVDLYSASGGTYTGVALNEAVGFLSAIADDGNVRKIVVLLTDGDPSDEAVTTGMADAIKAQELANGLNWELYTVALTTDAALISDMNGWSSNDGASRHENGIDYSYSGSTATQLESAFDSIIDSILGVTVGVISSGTRGAELTTSILTEGSNITLPWPENFACDPTSEQEVPIQLTFLGEGTITLSNLRMEYCAP